MGVRRVRFIQYGLGPIGAGIAELAVARGHVLIGAVDIDPAKVGRPASALVPGAPADIRVAGDAADLLAAGADVVLHSTRSRLPEVLPQILPLVDAGLSVISTCEELAFPWRRYPRESAELDALARSRGAVVVGTGVNPGFVMDVLPVVLALPCREVRSVTVERVVDLDVRREPLRRKAGVGLTPGEFRRGVAEGRLGHVGLAESASLIADALGWALDALDESVEPVLDPEGIVQGLHQVLRATVAGRELITLDLLMARSAPRPRDAIRIHGEPSTSVEIPGGLHGDAATSALVVNAIPRALSAPSGLLVPTQLPPAPFRR
ncbi:MAG: dihydrodipicolinate reductase [Armatimonadota bacterium]|nr:dihydrodipicolinate reductase [Armatimonadota bacterium]MDR7437070.1 dihydrodipicolinate reductase [Armatimonadota bacterium]MDR7472415.1 dihydrodipicolinate reductase [Armatimonadota bacterium]MDR7506681.1 dihydrodipicolinate reductase [Armatimonadota bacterium]MDR7509238.1 dihydrodipicolinate reductase [Armatimonadota bacterium]